MPIVFQIGKHGMQCCTQRYAVRLSPPAKCCSFVTCVCAVKLEYERMGYQRTGFMFEDTGSKHIFERFLGRMATLAEEQPVAVLEVKPPSIERAQ